MIVGSVAWAFYWSFPHYMRDQALAILIVAAGLVGLGVRVRRRRRRRFADIETEG